MADNSSNSPYNLGDYSLAHEGDDHYVIQHPDGSNMTIAKLGLPQSFQDAISNLPPAVTAQDTPSTPAPSSQPGVDVNPQKYGLASIPVFGDLYNDLTNPKQHLERQLSLMGHDNPERAKVEAQLAALNRPQATASNTNPNVQNAAYTTGGANPDVSNVALKLPTQQQPSLTPQLPTAANPMDAAFNKMEAANNAAAATAQKEGDAEYKAQQEYLDNLKTHQEAMTAKANELDQQNQDRINQIASYKVDPERVWKNMNTGNRVMAAISLFLGGLSGGLSGRGGNVALDTINQEIDRDVNAQKDELVKQQGLLSKGMEARHNLGAWDAEQRANLLATVQGKLAQVASKYKGSQAANNAAALNAQLEVQRVHYQMQAAMLGVKAQSLNGGLPLGYEPPALLQDKEYQGKRVVVNGRAYQAATPDEGKEVRDQLATVDPINNVLDKIDALGPSALAKGSHEYNQAQAYRSMLIPLVNENAGLKRLSDTDIENIKQQIFDPTSFSQYVGGRDRSDALRELLSDKLLASSKAKLIGYTGAPRPVGATRLGMNASYKSKQ